MPAQNLTCPIWKPGEHHPEPLATCDGRNRTTEPVRDTRKVFNMTGREALTIIDEVRRGQGDCEAFYKNNAEGLIPLLNIRFESDQFRQQVEHALRNANFLSDLFTRGPCAGDFTHGNFTGDPTLDIADSLLYSVMRNNMEGEPLIFGSAFWFKKGVYKNRTYFAPYAFKKKEDRYLRVKDLSTTWGKVHTVFLSFMQTRTENRSYLCKTSYFSPRKNQSADHKQRYLVHAEMEYIDGMWGRPYFECTTSKAWIVGYFVPFFRIRYDKKPENSLEFM